MFSDVIAFTEYNDVTYEKLSDISGDR